MFLHHRHLAKGKSDEWRSIFRSGPDARAGWHSFIYTSFVLMLFKRKIIFQEATAVCLPHSYEVKYSMLSKLAATKRFCCTTARWIERSTFLRQKESEGSRCYVETLQSDWNRSNPRFVNTKWSDKMCLLWSFSATRDLTDEEEGCCDILILIALMLKQETFLVTNPAQIWNLSDLLFIACSLFLSVELFWLFYGYRLSTFLHSHFVRAI